MITYIRQFPFRLCLIYKSWDMAYSSHTTVCVSVSMCVIRGIKHWQNNQSTNTFYDLTKSSATVCCVCHKLFSFSLALAVAESLSLSLYTLFIKHWMGYILEVTKIQTRLCATNTYTRTRTQAPNTFLYNVILRWNHSLREFRQLPLRFIVLKFSITLCNYVKRIHFESALFWHHFPICKSGFNLIMILSETN